MSEETLVDRWIKKLKDNPIIASGIVIAVCTSTVLSFYSNLPQTVQSWLDAGTAEVMADRFKQFCDPSDRPDPHLSRIAQTLWRLDISGLGLPTSCIGVFRSQKDSSRDSASIGFYERGESIWTFERGFYLLSNLDSRWQTMPESAWCGPPWCRDELLARAHFTRKFGPIPDGLYPPWAGMAGLMDVHAKLFDRFGWFQTNCQIGRKEVIFQKYERGMIIGPFPINGDHENSQFFILYNDRTFENRRIGDLPSECRKSGYN